MVQIDSDGTTIHITRGDATGKKYNRLALKASFYNFETEEVEDYEFQLDDKITFAVYENKGYTKEEILKKEYTIADLGYTEPTKYTDLILQEEDTKLFPLTNKKMTYWYVVTLNDTSTLLGHDKNGAKKIIVYPEADE